MNMNIVSKSKLMLTFNDIQESSYKFSLYIVSGLPIIARRGSNVGNYVETNHLGFTVDDVLTIDKTNKPYQDYITNVNELANKLRQGQSIIEKVNEIENIISTTR